MTSSKPEDLRYLQNLRHCKRLAGSWGERNKRKRSNFKPPLETRKLKDLKAGTSLPTNNQKVFGHAAAQSCPPKPGFLASCPGGIW